MAAAVAAAVRCSQNSVAAYARRAVRCSACGECSVTLAGRDEASSLYLAAWRTQLRGLDSVPQQCVRGVRPAAVWPLTRCMRAVCCMLCCAVRRLLNVLASLARPVGQAWPLVHQQQVHGTRRAIPRLGWQPGQRAGCDSSGSGGMRQANACLRVQTSRRAQAAAL